jgi:hypothetical protein
MFNFFLMKLIAILVALCTYSVQGQTPIDIAESTLKIPAFGEEVFYYGFAAGDILVFNFTEANGKELKEVEIQELPAAASVFMDYKTKKISDKRLTISRTAVYKFRFSNAALGGRVCKFKVQRIPVSEGTRDFNSTVFWKVQNDTTYVPQQEQFLVKSDTVIVNVMDQVSKVSSQSAINGTPNRTIVDFSLPEHTVKWSYFIGVGNQGRAAYEQAKDKLVEEAASTLTGLPGYGPLAALALYGINTFSKAGGDDNVQYWFISDWQNAASVPKFATFLSIQAR